MKQALQELDESRRRLLARLDKSDWNQVAIPTSGWRIRDVASHIAQWERIVGFAVEASLFGGAVEITPFDIDAINQRIFEMHRDRTDDALHDLLSSSREQLLTSVRQKESSDEILLPWGKTETTVHVVQDMLGHERHHLRTIEAMIERL